MYWVRSGDLCRCSHSVVSFCNAAGESHTKHKFAEALASGYEVVSVLRPARTLLQPLQASQYTMTDQFKAKDISPI